jgi:hypothetical protein
MSEQNLESFEQKKNSEYSSVCSYQTIPHIFIAFVTFDTNNNSTYV